MNPIVDIRSTNYKSDMESFHGLITELGKLGYEPIITKASQIFAEHVANIDSEWSQSYVTKAAKQVRFRGPSYTAGRRPGRPLNFVSFLTGEFFSPEPNCVFFIFLSFALEPHSESKLYLFISYVGDPSNIDCFDILQRNLLKSWRSPESRLIGLHTNLGMKSLPAWKRARTQSI